MSDPITRKPQTSPQKPRGAKKFFKTLGLLAQLRFADAVEYINDGDTEN